MKSKINIPSPPQEEGNCPYSIETIGEPNIDIIYYRKDPGGKDDITWSWYAHFLGNWHGVSVCVDRNVVNRKTFLFLHDHALESILTVFQEGRL